MPLSIFGSARRRKRVQSIGLLELRAATKLQFSAISRSPSLLMTLSSRRQSSLSLTCTPTRSLLLERGLEYRYLTAMCFERFWISSSALALLPPGYLRMWPSHFFRIASKTSNFCPALQYNVLGELQAPKCYGVDDTPNYWRWRHWEPRHPTLILSIQPHQERHVPTLQRILRRVAPAASGPVDAQVVSGDGAGPFECWMVFILSPIVW